MSQESKSMKHINLIIVMLIFSTYSLVSSAGPDKTTKLLMDTPASVFDIGMLQFNLSLKQIDLYSNKIVSSKAAFDAPFNYYKWDDNKIIVSINAYNFLGDKKDARLECLRAFSRLRENAGVDPTTSKVEDYLDHSYWSRHFNHLGYHDELIGKSLPELDKKFILSCLISLPNYSKSFVFTSPLLSTSVSEVIY